MDGGTKGETMGVQSHGIDNGVRWVADREGRKVRSGDVVDVPHEGAQTVVDLDLRDCGEDDGRTGLPIVTFAQEESDISGIFGWEYAASVTLRRSR
jgi:hypothetical protein